MKKVNLTKEIINIRKTLSPKLAKDINHIKSARWIAATNDLNTILVFLDGEWYLFNTNNTNSKFYITEEMQMWLINNVEYKYLRYEDYEIKKNYYFVK